MKNLIQFSTILFIFLTKGQSIFKNAFSIGLFLVIISAAFSNSKAAPGDVDLSFNPPPITWNGFGPYLYAVAIQPDGKILVGGEFDSVGGAPRRLIVRFNADGSVDNTFNPPLQMSVSDGFTFGYVYDIQLQPDGKILVGGDYLVNGGHKSLVRLHTDGSLDSTLNTVVNGDVDSSSNLVYRIALQTDGKIIIGGNSLETVNGVPVNRLARVNADGSLDAPLGVIGNTSFSGFALALQTDGKILVGGSFGSLVRLNPDGTQDPGFVPPAIADSPVDAIVVQPDGKILVGGRSRFSINGTPRDGLIRVNADGSLDAAFDPLSLRNTWSILLQGDGKIVVPGNFTHDNSELFLTNFGRLNADGSRDFIAAGGGPDDNVYDIARQADGKFIVVGQFESVYQGSGPIPRPGLARLSDNGGTTNAPPVLSSVAVSSPITENAVATLSGNIADADAGDAFSLTVDWGDGSAPQTFNYAAGTTAFSATHQYPDDNPTATPSDNYTINLTLSDGAGGSDTDSATVTVNNAAPVLSNVAVSPATITVGGSTTLSGNVGDTGALDTHRIVINWGDGSIDTTLNLAAGVSSFSATHQYNANGAFNIGVTATDDDTGSANAAASVTVNPLPPIVPGAPTNLTTTAVSTTQINLAWTDNSNNEDGFLIERCAGNGKCTNFVQIAQTSANSTAFSDTGLSAATNYVYRVRAFNAGGNSAYSSAAKEKTLRR